MSSRVIIPEIVGEGSQGRSQEGPGRFPHRPDRPGPAAGLGLMLRSLAAGVVLVLGVAAVMVLGGIFMIVLGAIFCVAWLASLLGGKTRGSRSTVVVQSTRSEGPGGRTILIERHYSGSDSPPGKGRPE